MYRLMSDSKVREGIRGCRKADSAAESTWALPWMSVWLGTHTKLTLWIISWKAKRRLRIRVTIGWVEWGSTMADRDERELGMIRTWGERGGGLERIIWRHWKWRGVQLLRRGLSSEVWNYEVSSRWKMQLRHFLELSWISYAFKNQRLRDWVADEKCSSDTFWNLAEYHTLSKIKGCETIFPSCFQKLKVFN